MKRLLAAGDASASILFLTCEFSASICEFAQPAADRDDLGIFVMVCIATSYLWPGAKTVKGRSSHLKSLL